MKHLKFINTLTVMLIASSLFSGMALAGPECTCRHSDGEVPEGQTACIKSPTGMKMARCESVLNNTSWKMLDAPCPYSEAPAQTIDNFSIALLDFKQKD
jgi:hypothetical protein